MRTLCCYLLIGIGHRWSLLCGSFFVATCYQVYGYITSDDKCVVGFLIYNI